MAVVVVWLVDDGDRMNFRSFWCLWEFCHWLQYNQKIVHIWYYSDCNLFLSDIVKESLEVLFQLISYTQYEMLLW